MICLISFSTLSDVFPAVTYGRAIKNFWNICWGVNILSPSPLVACIGDIPPL